MIKILSLISVGAVPVVISSIIIVALVKKVDIYTNFIDGAKEGLKISVGIIPPVAGLLVAIGMFRASGALDILVDLARPLTGTLKIPSEVLPFALLRPVSGSGSLAMATDIFKEYGVDSMVGRIVAVMMGSSETTFYTLAVYFGVTRVTDTRHTLRSALVADCMCLLLSVWICRLSL